MIEDMQFELILTEPVKSLREELTLFEKKKKRLKIEKKERKAKKYMENFLWHLKVVISVVELYHFLFITGFSLPTGISGVQQLANLLLIGVISG